MYLCAPQSKEGRRQLVRLSPSHGQTTFGRPLGDRDARRQQGLGRDPFHLFPKTLGSDAPSWLHSAPALSAEWEA
jgi:hypothetical protein